MKSYWLFTINTGKMLIDMLDRTKVVKAKTEVSRKVEVFAGFESRVKPRLNKFDMYGLKK